MTYPFNGIDDLLHEAFGHFTDRVVAVFDCPPLYPCRCRPGSAGNGRSHPHPV
ncbi:hypothetical protein ACWC3X_40065 [Streptomyces populi]